jgi:putative inorganic carbon (hco3(-)) transporter
MTHARYSQPFFLAWCALLIWAPLPFASNRPWALALLVLFTSTLALAMLLQALLSSRPFFALLKPYRVPLLLLALVALWVSLQLLPLPLSLLALFSPEAATIWQGASADSGSLSLNPSRTQLLTAWSWCLWLFFGMTLLLLDTRERIKSAAILIVCCGVFQALYGSFMTLSGIEYGFFQEKTAYRRVATGTFVNRNHLAGYLEMCLAIGIGLLVATLNQRQSRNWRDSLRRMLDTLLGSKMRLRVFLALMVIGLVLTRSRMGNTAFFSSLFITAVLLMVMQRKVHKGALLLFASLLLVDFVIVGQWFGFDQLAERLENTSAETEQRVEVVRDTLVLIKDYPLTGIGLGAYAVSFPRYQQADIQLYYDHAHNDYLQFTAELGAIGMLPLGLLVLLSLGMALKAMVQRHDPLAKGLAFAGVMGILALMIHSTVDFNLQMPANAQLFIVILALAWKAGTVAHHKES